MLSYRGPGGNLCFFFQEGCPCTCVRMEPLVLLVFFFLFYSIFRVSIFPLKRSVGSVERAILGVEKDK